MRKLLSSILAIAALSVMATTGAFAQNFLSTNGGTGSNGTPNLTWNGTSLLISSNNMAISPEASNATPAQPPAISSGVSINVGPLTGTGYIDTGATPNTGTFIETFGAGTFTVSEGGTTFLTGQFTGGDFTNGVTNNSITYQMTGVSFGDGVHASSAGTYFPGNYNPATGAMSGEANISNNGSLSWSALGVTAFNGNDGITWSAPAIPTTTPEPASFATFGIGALALLALVAFKRRNSVNSL